MTAAAGGNEFLDTLSGVGARGVRIAKEVSPNINVTINDFNASALRLAKSNAQKNGVAARCTFEQREAREYLYSRFRSDEKSDFVDVDPFGTPAPFLEAAFSACKHGGLVSITATDTAVLCGVYRRVALRRYGSMPLRNSFKHETAIRILANAARRAAAIDDASVWPLFAHVNRHYIRVFLRKKSGATKADEAMQQEGYVGTCRVCGENHSGRIVEERCPTCSGHVSIAGPLWVGPLVDEGLVSLAIECSRKRSLTSATEAFASVRGLNALPPHSYDVQSICSELSIPSVSENVVMNELRSRGFKCAIQAYESSGIKTDANHEAVKEVVSLAQQAAIQKG
jgi:tRNA (guanine26-N2/guanine27-N2)-dimethyltransferase